MKHTIRILPQGRTLDVFDGEILSEVIVRAGIPLAAYCNGKGLCGKCLVRIGAGIVPPPSATERGFLEERNAGPDDRLACRLKVNGPLDIAIPDGSIVRDVPVLGSAFHSTFPLRPAVTKVVIPSRRIAGLTLDGARDEILGPGNPPLPSGTMDRLGRELALAAGHAPVLTAVLHADDSIVRFEPSDTSDEMFGLAADIGTTTVAMRLVDLTNGREISGAYELNRQFRFGSDVVSRLTFAFQNADGGEQLRETIVSQLNAMIDALIEKNAVRRDLVYEIVIAANAAMNHFLCGERIETLAVHPFEPAVRVFPLRPAPDLGLALDRHCRAYVAPNIRSFVGGDITSGIVATRLATSDGNRLLMDLGTNGELVLKAGERIFTTSTAAGPAFEGMNISCGTLARPGAISKVRVEDGRLLVATIADAEPSGICGTGLLDLVACLLELGLIDDFGRIADGSGRVTVTEGVTLLQQDLRHLQLAVAAVKAGVKSLMRKAGVGTGDLDAVYVAGAFGNFLDPLSAARLGLIPPVAPDRIRYVGNSSLEGASVLLCSLTERRTVLPVIESIEHVSLSSDPGFQDLYVDALSLGPGFYDGI